ncbi:hypothetical protein NIES267_73890 (plasmid) [Calothrix parasitica NIES-267]|uniref:Uncharacterized protein n=1 Tax=Calothrix parasitica NIES-267 TaxID=1973488 RepID=A0A1Z4M339_9CYAN|nr:hypothetical protein NIES267_73890 [Calothrix parasitica NIES-267]
MKLFNRSTSDKEHSKNTEIENCSANSSEVLLQYAQMRLREAAFQSKLELLVKASCSFIGLSAVVLMLSGRVQEKLAATTVAMASTICCIPLSRGANSNLDKMVVVFKTEKSKSNNF